MKATEAIKATLDSNTHLLEWFVSDFSDADLLVRPVPGANHAAWQIGNVIGGDLYLIQSQLPETPYPELPPGFLERHGKEGASQEGPEGFLTSAGYLELFGKVRGVTLEALAKLSDEDLDQPTIGAPAAYVPNLGGAFLMAANHTLMHAGQFSVIRRKLGKPHLM